MKRDTREFIGLPGALLMALLCAYGLLKLIKSLPAASSDEAIFGSVLILVFIGVPLFFGWLLAIVAICMWMTEGE